MSLVLIKKKFIKNIIQNFKTLAQQKEQKSHKIYLSSHKLGFFQSQNKREIIH